MTNLDSILKSRDITLPTKVCLVKAMVLPVVMYGCESRTVKKAEHGKIYAFELWCWRRLLRVPWMARSSNQSILKEINPGCSLEGLMLRLKLQYFGYLMRRVDTLEKTLMLGGIGAGGEGVNRGWDGWMASPTRWTWVRVNSGSWWWTGRPGMHMSPQISYVEKLMPSVLDFGGGTFRKWLVHEHRTIMNECNAYINTYHVLCLYHTLAMVVIFLVCWGTFILFSIVAPSIYILINRVHTNATF